MREAIVKKRTPLLLALDALAYLVCTFAFALLWHVWLFKPSYDALGWITPDGTAIALGFAAVATQAVLLSLGFQAVKKTARFNLRLVAFVGAAFIYLWSSHVLGDAAKLPLTSRTGFIVLETAYLAIQFLVFGGLLWVIHMLIEPELRAQTHAP